MTIRPTLSRAPILRPRRPLRDVVHDNASLWKTALRWPLQLPSPPAAERRRTDRDRRLAHVTVDVSTSAMIRVLLVLRASHPIE